MHVKLLFGLLSNLSSHNAQNLTNIFGVQILRVVTSGTVLANAKETRRAALEKFTAISHEARDGNDDHLKYLLVSGNNGPTSDPQENLVNCLVVYLWVRKCVKRALTAGANTRGGATKSAIFHGLPYP